MKQNNKTMTPKDKLRQRMESQFLELKKIADKKTPTESPKLTYALIGYRFGITGETVGNYVNGRSKKGNGYLIDALIEEFKKL